MLRRPLVKQLLRMALARDVMFHHFRMKNQWRKRFGSSNMYPMIMSGGRPNMNRIDFLLCLLVLCASAQGHHATIYRDSFGVPHIEAESLVDAALGDGGKPEVAQAMSILHQWV